jgi:serpin B
VRDSRAYFEARVEALDFSRPDAPEIINGWVRDSTEGGIDELVSDIDPLVALFVTDAVYFKGNWATPFDPEHTRPQTFHQADGDEPEVPMMVRHGEFGYWAEPGLQAVSLPYSGDRLVFDVLLPDRVDGLLPLIEALDAGTLHERLGDFTPQRGTVMLPRVTLSYGAEIREALAALGMGVAFDSGRADLSGMVVGGGPGDLYISRVQHGTTLELSEEGTVAAAATVAEVRVRSIAPPGFELLADHPFMLAVRDRLTDAVLFAGLYRGPTA